MKFIVSVALSAVLVLGALQSVQAGACSGAVSNLKLREDETSRSLVVMWSAPSGETGCTYTISFTSNAPSAPVETFETDSTTFEIGQEYLAPCSTASVSVRTTDGDAVSAELLLATTTSTAPILLDIITSCDTIEMTWEAQPYNENMCEHTHFQLFCLSDTHNFTIPVNVQDEQHRTFHVSLAGRLRPDIYYTCNGYMFVTLAGFSPASEDFAFWSNLDSVRDLDVSEKESAIRAEWQPPLNSEQCGVAYIVTYENEVLGEQSQETPNTYIDLDAEIIPCTEYKVSVTPISNTGSHGQVVSAMYEPAVTQGSVNDAKVTDNEDTLTVSWTPVNIGRCNVKFVVEHYINDELDQFQETVENSVEVRRVPCSSHRFEIRVITDGNAGVPVTLELNLGDEDIVDISKVQNLQVSGNVATWDAPVSVGKCGIQYQVVHISPLGIKTYMVSETEASLPLIPCSENSIAVRGIASGIVGDQDTLEFVADAADLNPPENLRIIPDFTSALLTVRAETMDINACPITEALITCSKEGSPDAFGDSLDVVDNANREFELQLSGLEEDSIYDCQMRWANSEMGKNFRFRTIPIPKKVLTVTDITPQGFNVVWSEDYGTEFVLSYKLVINSHGPAHEVKDGCGHELSNTFVLDLQPGVENYVFPDGFPDYDYDVSLTTTYNLGSLGVTDQSDGLDTKTLHDVPGLPEDLQIAFDYLPGEAYNVTGVISWTAPCALNGALRSFGVNVAATFELGGQEHTLEYSLDVAASSPNDVYSYELKEINPFFRYVVSINTLAAEEGPSEQIVISPPDICSCKPEL